jgi:hypothetical protein
MPAAFRQPTRNAAIVHKTGQIQTSDFFPKKEKRRINARLFPENGRCNQSAAA